MKLNKKIEILDDVVKASITVAELGTEDMTSTEEQEALNNFNKYVSYKDIEFKGNIQIVDGIPTVVETEANDTTIVEVEIEGIIDKDFRVNEELNMEISFNKNLVKASEVNTVLKNKEMVAEAKAALWMTKVEAQIKKVLDELRDLATSLEGSEEVVL